MLTLGKDTYATLEEANQYFTDRVMPEAWDGADDDVKEAALRYATRWLDVNFSWIGYPANTTQPLGWPRYSAYDEELRLYTVPGTDPIAPTSGSGVGTLVDVNGIPLRVKEACCELALSHVKDGPLNPTQYADNPEISSVTAGPVSVQFGGRTTGAVVRSKGGSYPYIYSLLAPLSVGSGMIRRVVRS